MLKDQLTGLLLNRFVLIGVGGALGSVLRYLVTGWGQQITRSTFPIGTLAANVLGCFLIGLLNVVFTEHIPLRSEYRIALTVGLLGGLTTFSTFAWETLSMANDRQFVPALVNLLASVALGFAAVWLGYRLAQRLYGV